MRIHRDTWTDGRTYKHPYTRKYIQYDEWRRLSITSVTLVLPRQAPSFIRSFRHLKSRHLECEIKKGAYFSIESWTNNRMIYPSAFPKIFWATESCIMTILVLFLCGGSNMKSLGFTCETFRKNIKGLKNTLTFEIYYVNLFWLF